MFNKVQIKELQKLFQEELGIDISDEEACIYAAQLVNLLRETYKEDKDFSSSYPP